MLLDDTSCVQPDLIVFRDKKLIQPHALVGIPDLVIVTSEEFPEIAVPLAKVFRET